MKRNMWKLKMTLTKNLRQHESFITIDYDDLINFCHIDESDSEDKNSDL